jgi:hypothetical protein
MHPKNNENIETGDDIGCVIVKTSFITIRAMAPIGLVRNVEESKTRFSHECSQKDEQG